MAAEVKVGPDAATIVFFRLTGPPAAVKGTLDLDGKPIGKVFVRRFAILNVNPGRHELRFSFPAWASAQEEAISFECKAHEKYFVCYDSSLSLSAIIPVGPIVVFRITSGLKLVSEENALPFINRFDFAFTYGTKEPSHAPEPAPGTVH